MRQAKFVLVCATVIVIFLASTCLAQTAGNSAAEKSTLRATFLVQLSKSLDSRKLKRGDQVTTTLLTDISQGKDRSVARGSLVLGHVTAASVKSSNGGTASLGIVFDRIQVHNSGEILIQGVMLALAPDPDAAMASPPTFSYPDRTEDIYKPTVTKPQGVTVPVLDEQSRGVYGLKDLRLDPNGVLLSDKNNIKLNTGTRILISATMP